MLIAILVLIGYGLFYWGGYLSGERFGCLGKIKVETL
jgi:hypothetical protein